MSSGGVASGVVLLALGVLLIARAVVHDDHGQTLVDRVAALG
jgi:hypothetical protein